jgi:hypothetical protein
MCTYPTKTRFRPFREKRGQTTFKRFKRGLSPFSQSIYMGLDTTGRNAVDDGSFGDRPRLTRQFGPSRLTGRYTTVKCPFYLGLESIISQNEVSICRISNLLKLTVFGTLLDKLSIGFHSFALVRAQTQVARVRSD